LAVLAARGEHADALNGIGACIVGSGGDPEQAIAFFRRALQAAPAHAQARRNLAVTLLKLNRVRDAVQEHRELVRQKNGDLRVEFAALLAAHGWKEEAFQDLRQVLSRASSDRKLTDSCLKALAALDLPAAKALAAQHQRMPPRRRPLPLRALLFAGAALGLAMAAAAAWHLRAPAEKEGPGQLCREFAAGMPTSGLADRAGQLQIARLALFEPGGRTIIEKPLPELDARDWEKVRDRLARSQGRAVFGARPSISLNRWCTVEFSNGRITGSMVHSYAP
jgi:tetratricopeptide (TPR) repeat protein